MRHLPHRLLVSFFSRFSHPDRLGMLPHAVRILSLLPGPSAKTTIISLDGSMLHGHALTGRQLARGGSVSAQVLAAHRTKRQFVAAQRAGKVLVEFLEKGGQ